MTQRCHEASHNYVISFHTQNYTIHILFTQHKQCKAFVEKAQHKYVFGTHKCSQMHTWRAREYSDRAAVKLPPTHTHTHTYHEVKIKIFISRCDLHRADKVGRITYVYTYVWYIHTYGLVLLWSKFSTGRNLWNLLHREDVIYGMGGRIRTYHVCTYIRTCVYTYICMYTDILLKHSVST